MKRMKQLLCITLALSMLLCLAACGKKPETKAEAAPLHIATKPMTEQYILGEMLKLIIEDRTGYTCEITKGVGGGTSNIMPAMKSGDFDLYPEYTSSGYVLVLEHDAKGVEDDAMWEQLLQEYHDKFGMTWLGHYGFNNTYCLTVRGEVARQYNLKTCSDMTSVAPELIFGGNPDYIEREDGFKSRHQRLHYRRAARRAGCGRARGRSAPAGQLLLLHRRARGYPPEPSGPGGGTDADGRASERSGDGQAQRGR